MQPPVGKGNVATLDTGRVTAFAREAAVYVDAESVGPDLQSPFARSQLTP